MANTSKSESKPNSKQRHQAREIALQILYHCDLSGIFNGDTEALPQVDVHFEHFKVPPPVRPYAGALVLGTCQSVKKIDELIEKESANWKLGRMPPIDRNLIRMTIFELLEQTDVPVSVAIDEAVELAKAFGSAESSSFINGILDTIAKKIRQKDVPSVE